MLRPHLATFLLELDFLSSSQLRWGGGGDGEPISRLRYPPPEGTPSPAFSPLLFLSLPPVGLSLFSHWMVSSALQHKALLVLALEKNLFYVST